MTVPSSTLDPRVAPRRSTVEPPWRTTPTGPRDLDRHDTPRDASARSPADAPRAAAPDRHAAPHSCNRTRSDSVDRDGSHSCSGREARASRQATSLVQIAQCDSHRLLRQPSASRASSRSRYAWGEAARPRMGGGGSTAANGPDVRCLQPERDPTRPTLSHDASEHRHSLAGIEDALGLNRHSRCRAGCGVSAPARRGWAGCPPAAAAVGSTRHGQGADHRRRLVRPEGVAVAAGSSE
jgi:hypothetical protein